MSDTAPPQGDFWPKQQAGIALNSPELTLPVALTRIIEAPRSAPYPTVRPPGITRTGVMRKRS
jgi:hypothetical protein